MQGASPDQAKAEIEDLKQRLVALTPPSLTPDQMSKIIAVAAKLPAEMQAIFDGSDAKSANLAQDFTQAFRRAGWTTELIDHRGGGGPERLLVVLPKRDAASNVVIDALHAAGVDFDVQHGDIVTFGLERSELAFELWLPVFR